MGKQYSSSAKLFRMVYYQSVFYEYAGSTKTSHRKPDSADIFSNSVAFFYWSEVVFELMTGDLKMVSKCLFIRTIWD